jgi:hypothetical protein
MTPLDAVKWYDKHRGYNLDADTIERFLKLHITDTDQMVELGKSGVLDDLEAAPGLDPTPDNLRKLAVVGPDVMLKDPENVDDWIAIAQHSESASDAAETIGAFMEAGRGPSFARQVLDLVERTNENWQSSERRRLWSVNDLDISLPYTEIVDMIEAGLDAAERKQWAEAGFEMADAIKLRGEGLDLFRIGNLEKLGVARDDWARYVTIPENWFRYEDVPAGFTPHALVTLAEAGWQKSRIKPQGYHSHINLAPWEIYANGGTHALTIEQALRLYHAGLTNEDATKYFMESRVGDGDKSSPGALLPYRSDLDVDALIGEWMNFRLAGVKPNHLSDYRWAGCTSYQQILDAAALGITGARAKALRNKYGRKTGGRRTDSLRIDRYDQLVQFHQQATEDEAGVTRLDDRRTS